MSGILKSVVNFIPNLFTLINLTFGMTGVALAFSEQLAWAGVMVFVAAAFDFFDGFAARLLNAQSELGKQLDSLADMVAFGVLPGVIVYQWLNGLQGIYFMPFLDRPLGPHAFSFMAFLLTACSALRLAKFNIDDRQTENFMGLPTPAMAIFFASFPILAQWQYEYNMYMQLDSTMLAGLKKLFYYDDFDMWVVGLFQSKALFGVLVIAFAYLMVSPLPIVSMKFKSLAWQPNKWRFIFLGLIALTALVCFIDQIVYTGWFPWLNWLFLVLIIPELILVSVLRRILEKEA